MCFRVNGLSADSQLPGAPFGKRKRGLKCLGGRPFCLGDPRASQELVAADMKREDVRVYSGQRFRATTVSPWRFQSLSQACCRGYEKRAHSCVFGSTVEGANRFALAIPEPFRSLRMVFFASAPPCPCYRRRSSQ